MIVVVGLGNIGLAIAVRLHEAGHDVLGVDVADACRAAWAERTGRTAAADLDALDWAAVDRLFVVVRMTDQAAEVLDLVAARAPADSMITCHVVTTLETEFAASLAERDRPPVRVLEQPVSGGAAGAAAGTLTVLVAGSLTDDDEAFLTSTLAGDVVRFDRFGEPTKAKLINNVTGAYNARALADMLLLGQAEGIDPRKLYRVLLTSSGGSWMTGGFLDLLDEMLAKDVRLLRDELGCLPAVSLDDEAAFLARLAEARALLAGA